MSDWIVSDWILIYGHDRSIGAVESVLLNSCS
jgi:hypothetical protein